MDQPPVYGDRLGDRKPGPAALSHQRRQLRRSAIFTLVAASTSGNGPCSRRHNVQRLIAAHGPGHEAARSLGATLANCEKARSFSISDQSKAVCEGGLTGRGSQRFAWYSGLDVRRLRATKNRQ